MTDLADPTDLGESLDEPRQTKGERTRQALLDLAIDRFGSGGFRRTSVSEVARAAGLTQAAVYAYFANKEALFDAAVDADATALLDEATAQVAHTPPTELVPALLFCLFVGLDEHPLTQRVLSGAEPDAVSRLVELPALARLAGFVEATITSGQQAGTVRPDVEPPVVAAGIESLLLGLLFATVQSGGFATQRHRTGVVAAFDAMLRPDVTDT